MSPYTSIRRAAALLLAAGTLSCESSTGPDGFTAEYELVALASSPLPALPFGDAGQLIVADTIRLRADGTGQRALWFAQNAFGFARLSRDELTWRVVGDRLEVVFPCDDTVLASCIAPPHLAGTIEPGMQWVVPQARIYSDVAAVYQRVGMR